jgi:spore coat polysaccharide biosynthesis protein SpsF
VSFAVVIQARMSSERLPGKVLADVAGRPMLAYVVERSSRIEGIDEVVVATSVEPGDDPIVELCEEHGWNVHRGSLDDVLDRYVEAALAIGATNVLRVTADCPLLSWEEASRVVAEHVASGNDCTHNLGMFGSGLPRGTEVEAFTRDALEVSRREGHEAHHREHVDEYVYENPDRFRIVRVDAPPHLRRDYRLTVDELPDLELVRQVYTRLPPGSDASLAEVVALLDADPALAASNAHVRQKTV